MSPCRSPARPRARTQCPTTARSSASSSSRRCWPPTRSPIPPVSRRATRSRARSAPDALLSGVDPTVPATRVRILSAVEAEVPMPECARFAVFSWLLASPLAAQVWTNLPGADQTLARNNHAGAYDALRDRLVVFGGGAFGSSSIMLGDTLLYDDTRWTTVSTPVAPPARAGHGMAFDLARGRVVLFGG